MPLRAAAAALLSLALLMPAPTAHADSSSPQLASYYDRHMALQGDVAYGWVGRGEPRHLRAGVVQVGVDQDAFLALLADGTLIRWTDRPEAATALMSGVARFAAGVDRTAELIAEPILVQRRYPDGEFKVVRTISASAAIEATSFVVPVRPEGTAGFRAVQGSVESSVTTVTVKARLSKPVVSTRVKVGRATVVKGFIWPRHAKGSQPVTLNLYWRANPSDEWQLKSTVEPAIVGRVAFGAKWSYRWTPGEGDRGWWKLTASHADAMHEANTSRPKFLRVR